MPSTTQTAFETTRRRLPQLSRPVIILSATAALVAGAVFVGAGTASAAGCTGSCATSTPPTAANGLAVADKKHPNPEKPTQYLVVTMQEVFITSVQ